MVISEATALARAAAVRRTFPKGKITVAQAKAMVVAMADSQVGYASGSGQHGMYSKGGSWRTRWNGRRTYWCAIGASWCYDQCFGADAARAGIGWQNSNPNWPPVGWSATWLWRDWFRNRNLWVGMGNAQPGDISLQHWGRTPNATDHVEIVRAKGTRGSTPTIGFNTATGNPTAGAGVQRATRYPNVTVGIYRPDWDALVRVYNAAVVVEDVGDRVEDLVAVQKMLSALGYPPTTAGLRAYQKARGLTVDGIPGKNTRAALEADMTAVIEKLDAALAAIDRLPADVWGRMMNRAGETKPTVRADTLLRYTASTADVARIERALADVNGHPVDVAALADLLLPLIEEAISETHTEAQAEAIVAAIGRKLAPQED